MKISVVIPNYNGAKLLDKNLPKVINAVRDAEVIVVDDASSDDSVEAIKKQITNNKKRDIKLIQNIRNSGFSSTVNRGVKYAKGDLIVLLNTDVIPDKDFLSFVLPHFKNEQVFGVGCLQYGKEWKGRKTHGRGIGKFEKGFLLHAPGEITKKDTLWVFGGAGVFQKRIWEKLGGLSALYNPFYWEDIDLSYRALKSGYKLIFEPRSIVYHTQGESIGKAYEQQYIKAIAYRNQFYFVWLNMDDVVYLICHILYLPFHIMRAFIRGDYPLIRGFLWATWKLPEVISTRKKNRLFWKKSDRAVLIEVRE